MAPVTYSAQELLRIKTLPTRRELYDDICQKLQKDITIEDILRFPVNRSLPLIVEEENEKLPPKAAITNNPIPVQQLDGTDSEWRYRGRTDNESGESQPISAPPGLVAQKDEGFQRFYKAVVSPTHVRVTAGGRIVPNTRMSSSPTGKWPKEKPVAPGLFITRSLDREALDSANSHAFQPPFAAFPPMYPGYAPALPAPPYPLFPWHMYNAFCMPPPMAPMASSKPSDKDSSRNQQDGVDDRQDGADQPTQPVPGQADQGRPMYFNGQWPMPHNPPFFAYGMPALSGFSHPPMAGPLPTQPPVVAASSAPASIPAKTDKPAEAPKPNPAVNASPATQTTASLPNPPISSIRPSEITKKQIDVLKGSLKYLEDQLLYNKHQIDEKWMEYQAHMVRQQVQQFEKNLESQKSFEETHYPKSKDNSSNSADSTARHASIDQSVQRNANAVHETGNAPGQRSSRDKGREFSQFSHGINSTKSVNVFPPKKINNGIAAAEPNRKGSKLPVNAALAPPFQPQGETIENGSLQSRKIEIPYLIGTLPTGSNPDRARETGYQYIRDLTDDELRARHMYWGKAPQHLQRGLPRFDGKDFYPPSPARNRSSESQDYLTDAQTESGGARSTTGSVYDPFRSLGRPRQRIAQNSLGHITQSEALHVQESRDSSTRSSTMERGAVKFGRSYDDFRKVLDSHPNVATMSPKVHSDSEDEGDSRSILFKGRKPRAAAGTKSRNGIWQSMLNKGKSSGQAVPSTLSSATAHGVLPQYHGHATASLTPTIANTAMAVRSNTNAKAVENDDLNLLKTHDTVQTENMPPIQTGDAEPLRQTSLHNYKPQGILTQ